MKSLRPFLAWVGVVVCLLGGALSAQEPVTVSGRVVTGESDAPVAGAVVQAGEARTVTDQEGRFTLVVPPGTRAINVSAAAYLATEVPVAPSLEMAPVVVRLESQPAVREDVTVSVDREADPLAGAVAVEPVAVLRVAGAADNIFKALQTLPGVSATDDFGSRLSVRGGGPDQNLTVMDDVEIHNPYRLFGLTSAFNPETVERFELTAGGFGVEYGDRLSSILTVENRAGTEAEAFAGSAAISLTDMNVVLEGALPGGVRGSWLVTGRRTYYDLIADKITGNDLPSFADLQAKGQWHVAPGHTLRLFGLRSREKTDAEFTDSGSRLALGNASSNDLASLSYRGVIRPQVLLRSTVAWYNYEDDIDVDGSVRDDARRSNVPTEDGDVQARIVFTRGLGVRDISLRQQLDAVVGRHEINVGADAHVLRTRWAWTIDGDRNTSVPNGSSAMGGAGLPPLLASSARAVRAAAWASSRMTLHSRLRVQPGLRIDWSGVNDEVVLSPRISVGADLDARTRLRVAFGRFTQSPGYEKLIQSDYFVDLTDDSRPRLSSERAIHTIVGIERSLTPAVTFRVEGYSKQFSRLLVGRLETPAEAQARADRYQFPEELRSYVPTAPGITSVPENSGGGHAFGFDIYVEKRQRRPDDRLSGWASYTWGRARQDVYGVSRPFDYDRRHSISAVSTLAVSRRLDVGATLRLASGFPTTTPVGVRVAATESPDDADALIPAQDPLGNLIWAVDFGDVTNLARSHLPLYARLDVRATFKSGSATGRWQVYLDILNVLNRRNVTMLDPVLEYDPSGDRPAIRYNRDDGGFPLLPSVGFRYRF